MCIKCEAYRCNYEKLQDNARYGKNPLIHSCGNPKCNCVRECAPDCNLCIERKTGMRYSIGYAKNDEAFLVQWNANGLDDIIAWYEASDYSKGVVRFKVYEQGVGGLSLVGTFEFRAPKPNPRGYVKVY